MNEQQFQVKLHAFEQLSKELTRVEAAFLNCSNQQILSRLNFLKDTHKKCIEEIANTFMLNIPLEQRKAKLFEFSDTIQANEIAIIHKELEIKHLKKCQKEVYDLLFK